MPIFVVIDVVFLHKNTTSDIFREIMKLVKKHNCSRLYNLGRKCVPCGVWPCRVRSTGVIRVASFCDLLKARGRHHQLESKYWSEYFIAFCDLPRARGRHHQLESMYWSEDFVAFCDLPRARVRRHQMDQVLE